MMLERFFDDPIPYITGFAALVGALFLISKGVGILLKISHDVVEVKEWLSVEMQSDRDATLKELAEDTNEQLEKIQKDLDAMSTRVNQIERNTK